MSTGNLIGSFFRTYTNNHGEQWVNLRVMRPLAATSREMLFAAPL